MWSAFSATASTTAPRSRPRTSASRSTPPSISPRNPPTSSCSKRACWCFSEGVIEGRKVFANITKYIKMGASSNFGNMFSVLGASMFLPFLPMAPIQVLTNNLLYDFSQTAIPTDNVDEEYLAAPRKWDIGNIFKFMMFIGPISSIFDYVTFFMMLYVFDAWNNPSLFQTGWFVESLLTQTLIIHIIRTAKIPFFQSRASAALIGNVLDHLRDRHRLALHGNRTDAEVHAIAAALLAYSRRHAGGLWGHDAGRQNLVLSSLQHIKIAGLSPRTFESSALATGGVTFPWVCRGANPRKRCETQWRR